MKAADLFAGCGGLTEAARAVGVRVLWAANHNPAAVAWHKVNHPDVEHVCQDLRQADFRRCPEVDVLLAGPACQGHSPAGRGGTLRAFEKHDADRSTAWAVVTFAEVRRPAVLLVENVPQMLRWERLPAWRLALELCGYTLTTLVLNAADYGAPQERERLFIVGRLDGATVSAPAPAGPRRAFGPCLDQSHTEGWARVSSKSPAVQARVANGRRNKLGPRFLSQHVTGHPGRSLDRPIGTITCASGHWCLVDGDWMRPLTPRELARGQGFRDDFALPPQQALATRLIGNAVPVPLGAHVLRAATSAVRATKQLTLRVG